MGEIELKSFENNAFIDKKTEDRTKNPCPPDFFQVSSNSTYLLIISSYVPPKDGL